MRPKEEGEKHGRDRGDGVCLEEVGGHAGAVADVVADVVGDHRRVARVILGDAGFDLADQVGADVGGLGVDAAADASEDRDQAAAEAEPDQGADGVIAPEMRADPVVDGDAEEGEADDQQPGDRTAAEGDLQRWAEAALGGLGRADINPHADHHADVARGSGEAGADKEAERSLPAETPALSCAEGDAEDREHDDADHRDRPVLPAKVCPGARLHGSRDLAHLVVARR